MPRELNTWTQRSESSLKDTFALFWFTISSRALSSRNESVTTCTVSKHGNRYKALALCQRFSKAFCRSPLSHVHRVERESIARRWRHDWAATRIHRHELLTSILKNVPHQHDERIHQRTVFIIREHLAAGMSSNKTNNSFPKHVLMFRYHFPSENPIREWTWGQSSTEYVPNAPGHAARSVSAVRLEDARRSSTTRDDGIPTKDIIFWNTDYSIRTCINEPVFREDLYYTCWLIRENPLSRAHTRTYRNHICGWNSRYFKSHGNLKKIFSLIVAFIPSYFFLLS